MSDDYSQETPFEYSRYAYDNTGKRVAHISSGDWNSVQAYGRKGRRDMQIAEPYPSIMSVDPEARFAEQMATRFMWVNLMPRRSAHAEHWAIQFEKDEDVKTYLEWFPDLALKGGESE